jgi:predicted nucleic acid-binding protein
MAVTARHFFDTSVLVAGLIELGETPLPAERILDAVKSGRLKHPCTAWHCCLEFYSVVTRLPAGLRLDPEMAWRLMENQIFGQLQIVDLPDTARVAFLRAAAAHVVAGGRIYDAHIAEAARLAAATTVVTDNQRHFGQLTGHGVKVLSALDFANQQGL